MLRARLPARWDSASGRVSGAASSPFSARRTSWLNQVTGNSSIGDAEDLCRRSLTNAANRRRVGRRSDRGDRRRRRRQARARRRDVGCVALSADAMAKLEADGFLVAGMHGWLRSLGYGARRSRRRALAGYCGRRGRQGDDRRRALDRGGDLGPSGAHLLDVGETLGTRSRRRRAALRPGQAGGGRLRRWWRGARRKSACSGLQRIPGRTRGSISSNSSRLQEFSRSRPSRWKMAPDPPDPERRAGACRLPQRPRGRRGENAGWAWSRPDVVVAFPSPL